ncbi:hypothetical protein NHX12_003459 [Muraenolepis orangiensis]|uniref:Hepatocyte growth factor n=1 Tax=Muraenolepis orangiensis TaxID=630683 RepID=A0A9Q0DZ29_9TELE|nr:hypothetical protein NHX12_003459 [Muraenolepis orangiensis]
MWMIKALIGLFIMSCCESRRNALQDYQVTNGIGLTGTPADPVRLSRRKTSVAKCAKACNRAKRFPFICRAFVYDHRNRKCQWLSFDRNSHAGVQSQEDSNYQLYQKKDYVRECIVGTGVTYRGQRSVTVSGIRCQAWASPLPHEHKFTSRRYRKNDLRDNLCRNPDNSTVGPWCFTTDPRPHLRFQDCGLLRAAPIPRDLRENYCRNPDGQASPWCFTTDPRVRSMPCTNIPQCGVQNTQADDCYEGFGEGYQGEQSRTRSNLPCSSWKEHSSRDRGMLTVNMAEAYCRNPDKDKHGPWCYTNNSAVPWDYCNIQPCQASQNTLPLAATSPVGCFVHKSIRIVGGGTPNITDGSWMVSIQRGSRHWCGGSMIREEWVLTDRQCFSSCVPELSQYRVWLGVSDLRDGAPDWSNKQEISIAHVICGPEGSNLALIRLARPARPADNVHTVQLPVAGCSIPDGTLWTGHDDVLKVVDLPVVHNERCRQLHRGSLHISDANMCAGGRRNEGVCEGDYGGPLVCQEGESKVIVGVSVHGRSCARANQPSIFINVPFYTQWIHKVFKYYPDQQTF